MTSPTPYPLREPCPNCGATDGYLTPTNGQNVVRCSSCKRALYNAPKTETGEKPRTVSNLHEGISASQRSRILERANGQCEICGSRQNLHVGHMLSVRDGVAQGVPENLLSHDDNLIAQCETCNLGQGPESLSPKLYFALLKRRELRNHV